MSARLRLFLISFVILFFELACIRWFGATVIFLTFFTNIVLMACFLGMSVGCLSATTGRDFTRWVLPVLLLAAALAWLSLSLYQTHTSVTVDVGGQAAPQQIFFGTEYRANDPSQIVVPMEVIAAVFFVLIALVYVGLGQMMGRAFNAIPDRVAAYTADIAGSLAGIVAFGFASYLRTPAIVWFAISIAIFLFLMRTESYSRRKPNSVQAPLQLAAAAGVLFLTTFPEAGTHPDMQTFWSPYYKIDYWPAPRYAINTNNIGHQEMVEIATSGPAYALPHLLNRDAGLKPFQEALIIGAGSGNDVQAARYFNVDNVDAVEIDPVIQELGRKHHPDQPYSDARVRVHLDDGRSFIRKTDKKYDLVIYALVDSLVLHSGYSSLRLESFLFTRQAFEDIKSVLKPDGVFAMYNYYRQGWVVARLAKLAEEVFGTKPIVISLPYQDAIAPDENQSGKFTFILCGQTQGIKNAFDRHQAFWLNSVPALNREINGFSPHRPPLLAASDLSVSANKVAQGFPELTWKKIAPAQVETSTATLLPSDNWPFLYLRERTIPALNVRGMILIGLLSFGMLFVFAPIRVSEGAKRPSLKMFNWQMFLLGAGFMLLETKSVVHMALLFGATWIVNSFVFGAILLMILLSNFWVIAARPQRLGPYYFLLIVSLLIGALVPMNTFLAFPGASKVIASCVITFLPIFFAGVVFATSFRESKQPGVDFGSNIAGIILGGLCEYFSLAVGFNGLLIIAGVFYLLASVSKPRLREAQEPGVPIAA